MLVKICGVQDPETALFAATSGADFIGMVLSPGLKRSVTKVLAYEIVVAAKLGGAQPVGLFVSKQHTGDFRAEIEAATQELDISYIQAYGLNAPLSEKLLQFHVNASSANPKEFILLEGNNPGVGEFAEIITIPDHPWFLAGGLTPFNLKELIMRYRPHGVDVSSGVEKEGKKDKELILQFIKQGKDL